MPLSSLSAKTDFAFENRFSSRGRRTMQDRLGEAEPVDPVTSVADAPARDSFDTAYYASRFKADLSELKVFAGEQERVDAPSADAEGDNSLFDFFGNLSVLLVSVRLGDLARARAAADALEMEVMVEHSAGAGRGEAGPPNMLDDLRHLLSAAQLGDERAARAAAKDLARDVRHALEVPSKPASVEPALAADITASAYDTLMGYIEGDVQDAA